MATYLEFEKPIAELDSKIAELEALAARKDGPSITDELAKLKTKSAKQLKQIYSDLDAWRITQVARHPDRPHFSDFIANIFEDFEELAGDRHFGNDEAIIGGLARFRGRSVVIMGHEKGRTTEKRLKHNFGMAHPEGYRKAVRLMDLAEKFSMPVLSFPDTAGAYPGKGGEERGQAEAIARGTQRGLSLGVPFVTLVIGEGMSGGAIGIAAANRVLMMEYAIYSVISPEGCASILYRDSAKAKEAAEAMGITGPDLLRTRIVDGIVKEPVGGAHRDPQRAMASAAKALDAALRDLEGMTPVELRRQRRDRFYAIGREGL
ncbi:MAG: acetyl-CoA carboxylase carboxyltransferase subunit alpha [Hyphomonas sp.]|jgi:acetyl-CoA carboxylase carboxyl transferase subunit alpha|uniref:acetyl-CoA carboxylase carboxyltransferase subunit alpha n=1 Tax=Hyphomonas sp. TaxID=87 RepID=UPI0018222870|nr:acetyl-CoA carboxylase carboxyltransferase subunit alpha [Hyphomonas sp.]MBA3069990.1 acetyl-CoA carboxylase carboxyltransferase subunit alpha [Hyphomonas sp.]MBU3922168.1 acetyl-CoA carboxylase carboxyltransferase subunit alpha [Alphaproteobacteria bacterium]MBU4060434.1 acetyl-CoA carboxylase carboxyltransferase subunit alpha [Alphaproteobacteria bacterium]MBU4163102.1 acetyl-CoA carboxylase carboxyltransferase subunit alpha [Alphaproteobacteria bacterium]